MNKKIDFENHFSARVIEIIFPEGYDIKTPDDIQYLKKKWQENLKSWHTPYTAVFDVRQLNITEDLMDDFNKLIKFFEKFHMKKILGFKDEQSSVSNQFSFEIFANYDTAIQNTGLTKGTGLKRNIENLRERIVIDNDFQAHVMEISFLTETTLSTKADTLILKSKIQNILRMWHTPYNILFNCVNLKFTEEAKTAFSALEKLLKGFFCKEIIGYAPCDQKENYPFVTHRSRHVAAGKLNHTVAHSGDSARCVK